jgi:hypothetical protein
MPAIADSPSPDPTVTPPVHNYEDFIQWLARLPVVTPAPTVIPPVDNYEAFMQWLARLTPAHTAVDPFRPALALDGVDQAADTNNTPSAERSPAATTSVGDLLHAALPYSTTKLAELGRRHRETGHIVCRFGSSTSRPRLFPGIAYRSVASGISHQSAGTIRPQYEVGKEREGGAGSSANRDRVHKGNNSLLPHLPSLSNPHDSTLSPPSLTDPWTE